MKRIWLWWSYTDKGQLIIQLDCEKVQAEEFFEIGCDLEHFILRLDRTQEEIAAPDPPKL